MKKGTDLFSGFEDRAADQEDGQRNPAPEGEEDRGDETSREDCGRHADAVRHGLDLDRIGGIQQTGASCVQPCQIQQRGNRKLIAVAREILKAASPKTKLYAPPNRLRNSSTACGRRIR